ncbi:MAG TPA: EamA family transporter [Ktedonobacteraceae bacterium]
MNTIFFATYYSVTKEALNRIDPIIFTFFEMVSLAPAGLLIILFSWKDINRAVVKRGVLLGSMLCLALFTIAIALKYTTATSTAFFPALNGFVAALIAWLLFREPIRGRTWLAGAFSVGGAAILIFSSSMGNFRGTLIAFLGGLFYTGYIFLSDHEQKDEKAHWPLFGVELLTTAVWANLVALLFGDWQTLHPALPKDVVVVLYVAFACTFLSTLITVLLQKYISPVTVSFIYILEPVLGAMIANVYLGEVLSVQGYLGGVLVVLGSVISVWGSLSPRARRNKSQAALLYKEQDKRATWVSGLLYPGLGCALGALLLLRMGGMPPVAWSEVARAWPQFPLDYQQDQGTYVTLLLVQAGGWLVAWVSVVLMGGLALLNLFRLGRQPVRPASGVLPVLSQPVPVQSAQQARSGSLLTEEARTRSSALPAARQVKRPRVTTRLPEQEQPQMPQVPRQQAKRPRVTTRLPQPVQPAPQVRTLEHPTWYGDAIWNRVTVVGLGPDTPPPVTEPLPIDQLQTQYLYREKLDA